MNRGSSRFNAPFHFDDAGRHLRGGRHGRRIDKPLPPPYQQQHSGCQGEQAEREAPQCKDAERERTASGCPGAYGSPFLDFFAEGLGNRGFRVARFEYPVHCV